MQIQDLFFILAGNLVLLLAALGLLWLVSVRLKDASIIDIFWGPACAFGPVLTFLKGAGEAPRAPLLTGLVALWAIRLAVHLGARNLGHGEDFRYRRMREKAGSDAAFARWSLIWVFGLQGVIAWFVSLPAQIGQIDGGGLGALTFIGAAIYAIGFSFEAIGDFQLARFKAAPANTGKLMTKGLWSWTRHPNYFGDACVWAGIALIALESPFGWIGAASPFVMAHFLVDISGKALLERSMSAKYPDYEEYKRRTSGFVPMPPKR